MAGSDDSPSSAGGGIEVSPSVSETVMDSRPDVIPQMDRPIVPRLITVEQLEDVVMSNHANNCQQFRDEYKVSTRPLVCMTNNNVTTHGSIEYYL